MAFPRFPRSHVGRQDVRQTWLTPGSGGGRSAVVAATPALPAPMKTAQAATTASRAVTLAVAASDSSAAGKAFADYVCDGTADQDVIDAAVAAASAAGRGGVVQLLEGDFNLTADVNNDDTNKVWLRGLGEGTRLLDGGSGYGVLMSGEGARLSDLYVNGPVKVPWGQHCKIHDAYIAGGVGDFGAGAAHDFLSIYDCEIEGGISFIARTGAFADELHYTDLHDCRIAGTVHLEIGRSDANGNYLVVANNFVTGELEIVYGTDISVLGNVGWNTLDVSHLNRLAIAANVFPGGYVETSSTNVSKAGNVGTGF